ncbi:hypothetical protein [uncultured Methylobacterium sp.]|uniref:hypothetical protein n=1 Tax=uncultured Methylobacterium sp. TaxID=157278 RepID=UPI0035CC64C5
MIASAFAATLAAAAAMMSVEAAAQQRRHVGAEGPVVLRVDPDSGLPLPSPYRQDLRLDRAVPVPSVMNGSGFGQSGTDYYSDGRHEGSLGSGIRQNSYILAPALRIAPPH